MLVAVCKIRYYLEIYIGEDSIVEKSLLLDGVSVGNGCRLNNCIIDKYVTVPDGTAIGYDSEQDKKRFYISEQRHRCCSKEISI